MLKPSGHLIGVTSRAVYEVNEQQQTADWIHNIAQTVDHFRNCFANGEFNIANPGCKPDLFDSTMKQIGADMAANRRDRNKKTTT